METKKCKVCGRELPVAQFSLVGHKGHNGEKVQLQTCKECCTQKRLESQKKKLSDARLLRLDDFTPRELIAQLKRLGYEGRLTYTKVETIDLSRF